MPPENRPPVELLAQRALDLLTGDRTWIARRKEAISILNEAALRRTHSVDFCDPGLPSLQTAPDGQPVHWLPLFLLPKLPSQYLNFDFKDEGGRSLSLPSRRENAAVSSAVLRHAARNAISAALVDGRLTDDAALSDEMNQCLTAIAERTDLSGIVAAQAEFDDLIDDGGTALSEVLNDDVRFLWCYRALSLSSILCVPLVGAIATRKIVKLSFDEAIVTVEGGILERLGWEPYSLLLDLPHIAASTFHFQIEAPPGMDLLESRLIVDDGGSAEVDVGLKSRVHLYVPDASHNDRAVAYVAMRVRGAGFVGAAVIASTVVFAALLLCAVDLDTIAKSQTSAPALLLALPGTLAALAGRADDHPLTTRLLSTARRLLLLSAFTAYVAAAAVATHAPNTDAGAVRGIIICCAAFAGVFAWALFQTRRLPRPATEPLSTVVAVARWFALDEYRDKSPASRTDAQLYAAASLGTVGTVIMVAAAIVLVALA